MEKGFVRRQVTFLRNLRKNFDIIQISFRSIIKILMIPTNIKNFVSLYAIRLVNLKVKANTGHSLKATVYTR